ncbi:hypothetical protein ACFB49_12190 [Sphingomonas sp. DBB INV C78]|uniref:acetyl-CoA carboxylase biotin carboxyl carrier protein subunit n=1 Tax=Sphingomonas sp. DBB INV C78 TaxID=3349434 RepID=UPI0036D3411D
MPGFFLIDGIAHPAALLPGAAFDVAGVTVAIDGDHIWVHLDGETHELVWQDAITHYEEEAGGSADDVARAPMPGSVIQVAVAAGDAVAAGETMMIIESMKLETAIKAPRDGVVDAVHVAVGQTFERDAALVSLELAA